MLSAYERRVLSEMEQQLAADSTSRRARCRALLRKAALLLSGAVLAAIVAAGIDRAVPQALAVVCAALLGLAVGRQLGRPRTGRVAPKLRRLGRWLRRHA